MRSEFIEIQSGIYQFVDMKNHIYGPAILEKDLLAMSDSQINNYIDAIKKRKPIELKSKLPEPLTGIHFTDVIKLAKQHLQDIANNDRDDDMPHYIYEGVMIAIYGKDIFDWMNKRT